MYLAILFLPLAGSLLASNRKCGIKGGPKLSIFCQSLATLFTLVAFFEVGLSGAPVHINLGDWLHNNNQRISWEFIFDSLTVSMLIPVMIISTCVQFYAQGYLESDPHLPRFFSYLSLFTFVMILLVTGDNLFLVFMGWEGVGVVSYLLVNYWFTILNANRSGQHALFMNKIGDWGLIQAISFSVAIFADLSLPCLFALVSYINADLVLLLSLTFIVAASAKSAQISLHTWLAAAMAGPTPVSSLLHSSTMVTAGVYLLMRFSPILELSSTALMVIIWLGSLTAQLGAACGLVENDIKKIIAFSTSSQLGYMVVACGISQYSQALFHLINHAFFKSLLFLSAGALIHAVVDQQDIRRMGSLNLLTPITYTVITLGSLSLMAFPFMTGFYSKELLQELLQVPLNISHTLAYVLTLLAALLTSLYSIRLWGVALLSRPQFPLTLLPYVKDSPALMTGPLLVTATGAVILGYFTQEVFLAYGSTFYGQSLFTHPDHIRLFDAHFAESPLALIPLSFFLLVLLIIPITKSAPSMFKVSTSKSVDVGVITNSEITHAPKSWRYSHIWEPSLLNQFNVFNHWIMHHILTASVILYRYIDKGLFELFGPVGLVRLTHWLGFKVELLATGFIPHQIFIIILSCLTFIFSFIFIFSVLPISPFLPQSVTLVILIYVSLM